MIKRSEFSALKFSIKIFAINLLKNNKIQNKTSNVPMGKPTMSTFNLKKERSMSLRPKYPSNCYIFYQISHIMGDNINFFNNRHFLRILFKGK